jgi:hypothetical protein
MIYVEEISTSDLGSETVMTEVFCGLPQAVQEISHIISQIIFCLLSYSFQSILHCASHYLIL